MTIDTIYWPSNVRSLPNASLPSSHLILLTTLEGRHYTPHFINEETDTFREVG